MEYTDNQKKAIEEHSGNLLVSAAAGSGKTAVLVKRIEQEILRDEDPFDIDRILVMTFTKAAANEMKERILKAINDSISEGKGGRRLYRQAALISNAHISTIHGFCLDVIKNHFHVIGLSPNIRVMDEAEGILLKQDVLKEVMEEAYEEGSESFLRMSEHIATGRNDENLSELVLNLHKFAVSNPDADAWLDLCIDAYSNVTEENFEQIPLVEFFMGELKKQAENCLECAEKALEISKKPHGPYMYEVAITGDIECATDLVNANGYDALYQRAVSYNAISLSSKKDKNREEVDDELRELAKAYRNKAKAGILDIAGQMGNSVSDSVLLLNSCKEDVTEIILLTRKFYHRFLEAKKQKNLIDYNDMEHYCLKILTESTAIASEYREYFREIYVDEYQDSNLIQDAIVGAIAKDNIFLVGDVKQSIYSFRMARPELFMERYEQYKKGDGGMSIDLSDNFRSRLEVVNSVNEIFCKLMHKNDGGIEYDDDAKLNYNADCYGVCGLNNTPAIQFGQSPYRTEFLYSVLDPEVNKIELEALMVAKRIEELIDSKMEVFDKKIKSFRQIRYSDICILSRVTTGLSETFCRLIESKGIPIHALSTTGYFDAPEIIDLIEFLKIIDNPLQDIPLAAVMKSPMFKFDDEELAKIRASRPKGSFYEAVYNYPDNEKVRYFLETLHYYKEKSSYTSVYEMLREIIDGEYGRMILASKGGEKRYLNLNMLLSKALDYANTSYKGLFQFVRYIDYLKKNEIDYGEASINSENDNSVRLLSIHKSKGLEFPVVFLCGMHKGFNFTDSREGVIADSDFGIGLDYIDSEKRTKYATTFRRVLVRKSISDSRYEEMRLFYVAMTRAREKLIMTGVVKDPEKELNKDVIISKTASYLDFLVYSGGEDKRCKTIDYRITDVTELIDDEVKYLVNYDDIHEILLHKTEKCDDKIPEENISSEIKSRLNFSYQFDKEDTFAKISVTELKKRSMEMHDSEDENVNDHQLIPEEEQVIPLIPAFISKEEKSVPPTVYGTAFHRMLEIWDYTIENSPENVKSYFNKASEEKKLEADLAGVVNPMEIYNFLISDIGIRMKRASNAGLLKREQPFVIKDESGMLVQGIIDAYFIEDNEIVLVDYKTDVVNSGEELIEKYRVQLDYYGKALERLLKLPVKEKIIYSRRLKESVIIP